MSEEWGRPSPKRQRQEETKDTDQPEMTGRGLDPHGLPPGLDEGQRVAAAAWQQHHGTPPGRHPLPPYDYGPGPGMMPPHDILSGYQPMPPHGYQHYQHPGYGPPPPMGYPMYPPPPAHYGPPPYAGYPPQHYPQTPYDMPPPHQSPYPYYQPPPQHMMHHYPEEEKDGEDDDGMDEMEDGGEMGTYTRLKMYVKPKVPTRQEILDRRARKNAQSRSRASKLRERIQEIKVRVGEERTDEERALLTQYEGRRGRKNDRSRDRAIEKKSEIERILNKPERKRTKLEKQFLETALNAKQRKNEGDRLRRQRIKSSSKSGSRSYDSESETGESRSPTSTSGSTKHPSMIAHPPDGSGYGSTMPDIPMSPLPSHAGHVVYQSPGMPGIGFPSPPNTGIRGRQAPASNSEAPGGTPHEVSSRLPFMPPSQQYDDASGDEPPRSQLHLPQRSSDVEQRRNPDGSLSISIGGGLMYNATSEGEDGTLEDDDQEQHETV